MGKIKGFVVENKKRVIIVLVCVTVLVCFLILPIYFFSVKPSQVRKDCYKKSYTSGRSSDSSDYAYEKCLKANGLNN